MAITNAHTFIISSMNATSQGVILKAGMCLTTYYLSLLRVHQVHAKQDTQMKGIISGILIIVLIWQNRSLAAAFIISSTIATTV
jgi:hypothetical protein